MTFSAESDLYALVHRDLLDQPQLRFYKSHNTNYQWRNQAVLFQITECIDPEFKGRREREADRKKEFEI